jgi:Etoposide-induced protein 2.4 (EI24)
VFMTPAVVKLVAERRFSQLQVLHCTPWWASVGWSLGASGVAAAALLLSLPLWLLPPFGLILPPLIWGWLTYRVMAFDALAGHATPDERATLLKAHRMPLLAMGVVCGFLGAAPTMLWALSALALVLAPFVVALSLWVYTLVFAFASLWFAHYLLQALQTSREQKAAP